MKCFNLDIFGRTCRTKDKATRIQSNPYPAQVGGRLGHQLQQVQHRNLPYRALILQRRLRQRQIPRAEHLFRQVLQTNQQMQLSFLCLLLSPTILHKTKTRHLYYRRELYLLKPFHCRPTQGPQMCLLCLLQTIFHMQQTYSTRRLFLLHLRLYLYSRRLLPALPFHLAILRSLRARR